MLEKLDILLNNYIKNKSYVYLHQCMKTFDILNFEEKSKNIIPEISNYDDLKDNDSDNDDEDNDNARLDESMQTYFNYPLIKYINYEVDFKIKAILNMKCYTRNINIYIQYVNRALELTYNKYDSLDKYLNDVFNVNDYKFVLNNIDNIDITKYNENIKNGDTIHIYVRVLGGGKKLKKKREFAKMKKLAKQQAKKLKRITKEKIKIENELKKTQNKITKLSGGEEKNLQSKNTFDQESKIKEEVKEQTKERNTPQDWNDFLDKTKNPKYNPFYIYGPDFKPLKNKVLKNDDIVFITSNQINSIKKIIIIYQNK